MIVLKILFLIILVLLVFTWTIGALIFYAYVLIDVMCDGSEIWWNITYQDSLFKKIIRFIIFFISGLYWLSSFTFLIGENTSFMGQEVTMRECVGYGIIAIILLILSMTPIFNYIWEYAIKKKDKKKVSKKVVEKTKEFEEYEEVDSFIYTKQKDDFL